MCLLLFFRFAEVIAALRRDERIRPAGGGGRFHTISFLLAQKRNGYSAFCRGAFTRPDVKWGLSQRKNALFFRGPCPLLFNR